MEPVRALLAAIEHHQAGRCAEAEATYRAVLAVDARYWRAAYLCGLLQLQGGSTSEAVTLLAHAVALQPDHSGSRINFARALLQTGEPARALAEAQAGLIHSPDLAELHFLCGTALSALQRPAEAMAALARAAAIEPRHAVAWLNLGNACADLDRLDEAERHCRTAMRLAPALVEAHASLGFVLTSLGRLGEARAACAEAIQLAPDCAQAHWNLATAALLGGDFETGFREYEWRKRHDRFRRDFINPPGPAWQGEPVVGRTVLVHAEQGLGDTIQLSRFLPVIAERGARVVLACAKPLIPLLSTIPGLAAAADKSAPLPGYDVWIDQMSLPRVFGTRLETIPAAQGWLVADPARAAAWELTLPDRPRVGVVWAGNPAHSNDRRRSLPPAGLAALAAQPGVRFISLQTGPRAAEARLLGIPDNSGRLADYAETAAAVSGLDLIVTVDTSVAHLAGAMGKLTWVMLPFAPDWRWALGRDDTPWYSSLRLFRQPFPGDWGAVLDRVQTELTVWARNRSRPIPGPPQGKGAYSSS